MGHTFETGRTLPPQDGPSLVGKVLGAYRIITELGAGGMGTVWYAEHRKIGRRAAIKVLRSSLCRDSEAVSRFLGEARAVNEIRHPNIVEVTDFGEEQGLVYLVMEMLEGETLGARIERSGPMPLDDVIRALRQLGLALGAAHDRGITHRDLKPENIFLCSHEDYPDRVKILDFGIAKLGTGRGFGQASATQPGMVMGTPTYMSPEQCVGDAQLGPSSDQYSLAIVTYEMLTGTVPFTGQSFGRLVVSHTSEKPTSMLEHRPDLPPALDRVVLRALSKDADDRYADVRAYCDALRRARREKPLTFAPASTEQAELEHRQSVSVGMELTRILRRRLAYGRARLPGIPMVVMESLEMLRRSDADLEEVGTSIERDPLLASRLLRLVNSSAYSGKKKVVSVQGSICRLGTRRTRSLLLELSVQQVFSSRDPRIRQIFRQLWEHCVAVAVLARQIALKLGPSGPSPEEAHMAGLLHDVGKPIVAVFLLDAERNLLSRLGESWLGGALWLKIVENTHRQAGGALAREWQLPESALEAIEHQERYNRSRPQSISNIIQYADALVRLEGLDVGEVDSGAESRRAQEGRELLNLTESEEASMILDLATEVHGMTSSGESDADVDQSGVHPQADAHQLRASDRRH